MIPVYFDARPLLARGVDPFAAIQEKWESLGQGATLAVCAPFEPRPLIAHFSSLGVKVRPGSLAPGECWIVLGPKPC